MTTGSFYLMREAATIAVIVARYGVSEAEARRVFGELVLEAGREFVFNHTAQELAAIAFHDYRD